MKNNFTLSLLLLIVLVLAACGDSTSTTEDDVKKDDSESQAEAKENTSKAKEAPLENILKWEATSYEDSDFEVVNFESGVSPRENPFYYASNGALILGENSNNYFFNYLDGTKLPLKTDEEVLKSDAEKSQLYTDQWIETNLFGNHFYGVVYDDDKYIITQTDVETGEMILLTEVSRETYMTEKEGILYVVDSDQIFALDTESNKKIWEKPFDMELGGYPAVTTTDNAVIVMSTWGFASYSMEDGEQYFEEDGEVYDIATDGDTIYVLANDEEYEMDSQSSLLNVFEYKAKEGNAKKLFTTPETDAPYEEHQYNLDLVGDKFYIHVENGLFAYDATDYSHLWTVAVGDSIKDEREVTGSSYSFLSNYTEDQVYTLTEKFDGGDGDTFLSVIDPETGEMTEHYSLGYGDSAGPFIDNDKGNMMVYFTTKDASECKAFIRSLN